MNYDVSYDVAALVIVLTIYAIHFFFYSMEGNNRIFRVYIGIVAVNCVFDIISAHGVEQIIAVTDEANQIIHTLYIITSFLLDYFAFKTIAAAIKFESKKLDIVNLVVLFCAVIVASRNIFGHGLFYYSDGQYIKNDYYPFVIAVFGWYVICATIIIIRQRKTLTRIRFLVSLIGILSTIIPVALQFIYTNILFVPLGATALAFVMMYTLETPDYEKLQLIKKQLEEARVKERESREQAEESNADKTRFLENMSHELRTPINAILGFNRMILLEKCGEDTKTDARNIQEAGNTLLRLVGDILDYSQIETDTLDIKPEEYDTIGLYIYNMGAGENNIDANIPQKLYGDIDRIRQVLGNLYTYGKEKAPDANVIFKLNNLGIDDDTIKLRFSCIFKDSIFDLDLIKSGKQEDLYSENTSIFIASKILTNMDSELKCEYPESRDTVLYFDLEQRIVDLKEIGDFTEAWRRYEKHRSSNPIEYDFIAPTANILAVDDVKINLMVLSGLLKKYELNVKTVTSGAEAIKYMEENEVDLVFMDIMMPEMDGVETLHAIRENEKIISKKTPIIALTANVTAGAKQLYLSEGFDGYMSKPIDPNKMGINLRHFLVDKIVVDWDEVMGIDSNGKALKTHVL